MNLIMSVPHNGKWYDIHRIDDGRYIVKLDGDQICKPLITRTECVELIKKR